MKRNSYLYKEYVFSLDTSDRVKTNKKQESSPHGGYFLFEGESQYMMISSIFR